MSAGNRSPRPLSTTAFLSLAKTKIRQGIALTPTLLLAIFSLAQETPPTTPQPDSQTSAPGGLSSAKPATDTTTVTVAAGNRMALVLTQPIRTRDLRRGDDIYAQVVSPVTASNEVVIPPGTFVQGKVDKLERHGGRGELRLQSMSITFPDGYTAPVAGPVTLESPDGYALKDPGFSGDKLDGVVEVDETYIGGKTKGMGRRYTGNKTPVVSLVQRDGRAHSQVMGCVTGHNLKRMLNDNIERTAKIYTDQHKAYPKATKGFRTHKSVNHGSGEYVRGDVHTNTVEGFFSLLKRGVVGTFHHVSAKHLPLYLAEFDHRYNCRDMTDGERTVEGIAKAEGKRLTYSKTKLLPAV